ncbi:bifunctional diaminohydroxyphosphoribosylaminopyrimidine deaminase/5-amino-6-(5-phosphoribosylamino)uracil reductase RibD [Parafrigoribacterium mesophilum]|uniref:bifunctional diaminohydroxyphosphoribosylaminopyrimidine deaminase/5-amino-6-(5-phosphoribosylamino)uracil reductase RibD n=1 Tax=Parafrigoribacterium mesophilum TaxID=433646 RepID=UPI003D155B86
MTSPASDTAAAPATRAVAADIEHAMSRALELAARGPATGPNPQVGCVILSPAGHTLAEGWHRGVGTPHAEVDALAKLDADQARGATAVVTLEPCNHTGHTGPCSEALIEAGITRVFYALSDPNPVAHGGAQRLRNAGVEVVGEVLADAVSSFMHDWLAAMSLGRPYITLKWASSLDGRTAAADGSSQWITGESARAHAHRQRAKADAILVGTGTVLTDNPALTARAPDGTLLPHQPIPVVVGERPVPPDARLFTHPQRPVITASRDLSAILAGLFARGVRHAFVEGGPTLTTAFVAAGLVDEYLIYLAPTLLGGPHSAIGDIGVGTIGEQRRLIVSSVERLGDDTVLVARPATQADESTEEGVR